MNTKPDKATIKIRTSNVLRFAHPFYTNLPPKARKVLPGIGRRMTDYVVTKLEPIPAPQREPVFQLEDIIGVAGKAEIIQAGAIFFHATGDTGETSGDMQQLVADAMSADYDINHPAQSPAYFLHLGDVNYYANNDRGYHEQFYVPYKTYPGKIIAIPGNHDGELFKFDGTSSGQSKTLEAFQQNFCQKQTAVPPAAGTIYREMISQPGVYWLLETPFVDIIGLYSNVAENPGFISGAEAGTDQKNWLIKTLKQILVNRQKASTKALLLAVHHPPFSNGGHAGSAEMLQDIDDCCGQAGLYPDAVLAAHAHNYQRYTRYLTITGAQWQIPYLVAGGGGRPAQPLKAADQKRVGDHSYEKSLQANGYLLIKATPKELVFDFFQVKEGGLKSQFDHVTLNLASHSLK